MKNEFSSPAKKQESSPEGKLEVNYTTNNKNIHDSRHLELDSRSKDTE
jgi:hypothetical protein